MFQIYDEPESPAEEACLRYMMTRTRLCLPCKVALKHVILSETHHANIVFANGGGAPPPTPPLF